MKVKRATKYRIYPNEGQKEKLSQHFGSNRFVWNHFLRERIDYYAVHGKGLTYHDNAKELTNLKRDSQYEWLKEVTAQTLQQTLRDLDTAYNNFFNKRAKFPRFKAKTHAQSFRVPQDFRLEGNSLRIPKILPIRIVLHRRSQGEMRSVTISCNTHGWYFASILFEVEIPEPAFKGKELGIDLGLKDFLITSEGDKVALPKYLRKSEKRLRRLQRKHSKRKNGSSGKNKLRLALAKQHTKVANCRADFLHKLSLKYVCENQALHIEDLNVKGMVQNRRLAKSISDAGWGEFIRQLEYKGKWYGCIVNKIDRFFPSSKRCSECGFVNQDLQLKQRSWECPECKTEHDRDINAAKNILTFSTAGTAGINADADGEGVRP